MSQQVSTVIGQHCSHCGDECSNPVLLNGKAFCCPGCRTVYSLLNSHQLNDYYCLNEMPGNTVKETPATKFQFLDNEETTAQLISFKDPLRTQVTFYLPQIHCSSCLWLLENLKKLNDGILYSRVNFLTKKLTVNFSHGLISLRTLAELLATIGYEPHINLQDTVTDEAPASKRTALKLGITGFCFANIMLISFPEYLGLSHETDAALSGYFRYINLLLSLPVLIYGAREFFVNAWKGFNQKMLNIDAPIALAIAVTFCRSMYEILTHTGAGYLDSMSGIVFFMLVGRTLQSRTFSSLRFNRNFRSYFPVTVTVIKNGVEIPEQIQHIKKDDVLLLHHLEIVPVDCILSRGHAVIDNSFVTGENAAAETSIGGLIYAGGKIIGGSVEVIAVKSFSQSGFTQLWNNAAFNDEENNGSSFVTKISKYFSLVVLLAAFSGFIYWYSIDTSLAWNAMTAVLIVACPCTLLLSSSFTFGFVMQLFAGKGMFVKNAAAIEQLAGVNHIVFDKTGTITESSGMRIFYKGDIPEDNDSDIFLSIMSQSIHPLSRALVKEYEFTKVPIVHCKETAGAGIEAWVNDRHYKAGSAAFVQASKTADSIGGKVYLSIDGQVLGHYSIENKLRKNIKDLLQILSGKKLTLLSGDNATAGFQMKQIFPAGSNLLFDQTPQQKLDQVSLLQQQGDKVLMIGDGLNDAGALKQSDVGISVVEDVFSFTPACDAVMDVNKLSGLHRFIQAAKNSKLLIIGLFTYSLLYNTIGLYYALSAQLQPIVAAILMPASSISVICIAFAGTKFIGRRMKIDSAPHDKNHVTA